MINVISLLKFGSKENIEKLLNNGEIYMNTISYFKELEKDGVGDKFEGITKIKNYTNATITLKIPDNPITLKSSKLQLWQNRLDHIGNIYSTYAISDILLKRKAKHKIDKRMTKFGSHCLVIKDIQKFVNLILNKLNELGHKYSHNVVRYHDYSKNERDLSLYNKSHKFCYQKEHRIIVYTEKNEPLKFEIGSMREYAELYSTEEIIKHLVLDYVADPGSTKCSQ